MPRSASPLSTAFPRQQDTPPARSAQDFSPDRSSLAALQRHDGVPTRPRSRDRGSMPIVNATIPVLQVRDLDASVAFYQDKLGFSTVHREVGFAILRRDSARLHLTL